MKNNSVLTLVACPSSKQAAAEAPARTLTLVPANTARRFAITRIRSEFIVCTYVMGACIKRDYYASREKAWERISELRNGCAL